MSAGHPIIAAIEDLSTAGAVAADTVRMAIRDNTQEIILAHVLDEHTMLNAMLGMAGAQAEPVMESDEDGERLLAAAEQMVTAEFNALGRPLPTIRHALLRGHIGKALSDLVAEHHAALLVVGARRPHLFGRLTHADVRAHLAGHSSTPIHVASLQEAPPATE